MSIKPKMSICDNCGTEHQTEGQWELTNLYRYRIHYPDPSPTGIGPATELKVIERNTLKGARDYAKQRALELGGRVVEVYKLEAV